MSGPRCISPMLNQFGNEKQKMLFLKSDGSKQISGALTPALSPRPWTYVNNFFFFFLL